MKTILMCILFTWVSVAISGELQKAAFSVRIRDDEGRVVSNATVRAGFYRSKPIGSGAGEDVNERFVVQSDTNGMCSLGGHTSGSVAWGVEKEGYYSVIGMQCVLTNQFLGRFLPWDKLYEVRLRKIINPVPMYARRMANAWPSVRLPEIGKAFGFDLIKSDWVATNSKGEVPDFLIRLNNEPAKMPSDYYERFPKAMQMLNTTLTISFLNPGDGIQSVFESPHQGSVFHLPRYAPEDGYESNLTSCVWAEPGRQRNDMSREDQNYFFRVRSRTNEQGKIVGALYGKIHGPFRYRSDGSIEFTYYLNPTPNDRNLEFDPKQNLFKDLKSSEQVHEP